MEKEGTVELGKPEERSRMRERRKCSHHALLPEVESRLAGAVKQKLILLHTFGN